MEAVGILTYFSKTDHFGRADWLQAAYSVDCFDSVARRPVGVACSVDRSDSVACTKVSADWNPLSGRPSSAWAGRVGRCLRLSRHRYQSVQVRTLSCSERDFDP